MCDDKDMNKDEEWGNLSLPGFTHEQLMDPNLNYVLANLARNKDPKWLSKQQEIYKSPRFAKLIAKISKEKWSDPEFQAKQHIARILAWANDDKRRKKVSEWASQPKTEKHKKNISTAQISFYQTEAGKKALASKSKKQKGVKRPIVTCPHCGKQGADRIMGRWHFNNCKNKGKKK